MGHPLYMPDMRRDDFKICGERVRIYPQAKIIGQVFIELGSDIMIDDFVLLMAADETKIGSFVHLGCFSSIMGGGRLTMGDFSGISAGVRLWTGNDDYVGGALTNPTVPAEFRAVSRSFIDIGRHCIVGTNSVVLPGVKIGEGAVVGANSLVKEDLEPWTINVGNPTRTVSLRRRAGVLEREKQLLKGLK